MWKASAISSRTNICIVTHTHIDKSNISQYSYHAYTHIYISNILQYIYNYSHLPHWREHVEGQRHQQPDQYMYCHTYTHTHI